MAIDTQYNHLGATPYKDPGFLKRTQNIGNALGQGFNKVKGGLGTLGTFFQGMQGQGVLNSTGARNLMSPKPQVVQPQTSQKSYPQASSTPRIGVSSPAALQSAGLLNTSPTKVAGYTSTYNPMNDQKVASPTDQLGSQGNIIKPKPEPTTFSGLIGGLADQPQSPYNKLATDSAQRLQTGTGEAYDAYERAVEAQRKLKSDIAGQYGAIESQAIPLEFQQGRSQALARQYASQLEAAQGAVGQQQQAITQQQAGLLGAGNLALTGQSTAQSGLLGAAGLAQPSLGNYGQAFYSPLTGGLMEGPMGGGALNPLNNLQSIAQQVLSGQISPQQAEQMGGAVQGWSGILNQELMKQSGGGYNAATQQAQYEARQGVTTTQEQQVQQYKSAHQQAQNLQSQLSDLITSFGLNPSDINKVNEGIQFIANNVSDPRYKMLQNYVNDVASRYAQILTPVGGAQTDMTRSIAGQMLDETAKGTSLLAIMQGLDQQAEAIIAGVRTLDTSSSSGDTWGDIFGN